MTERHGKSQAVQPESPSRRHVLFSADEMRPGEVREALVGKISVVVARKKDGSYAALRNRCPHQGVPLIGGRLLPRVTSAAVGTYELSDDYGVLDCPQHGFEFGLDDGCTVDGRMRVRRYRVSVENGQVIVEL